MNIAKLILHYNTFGLTMALARSVPDSIIIDNGSINTATDYFPTVFPNRKIRFEDNLGFTPNWNRAIRWIRENFSDAGFDAFWLMNSDIQIDRHSVNRIEDLMNKHDIPMITPAYNCWMRHCTNLGTGSFRPVTNIEFTAPVIRADVFDTIGYFDERFKLGYGVEFDFAIRMRQAGFHMYCDDGSSFYHIGQQTINKDVGIADYSRHAIEELRQGMTEKWGADWKRHFTALNLKTV